MTLALGILPGCGKSEPSGDTSPKPGSETSDVGSTTNRGTIGFSALTLTNPFFKVVADSMQAEAKKHDYDMILVSGERDVNKQADQIDDFIVKDAIESNPELAAIFAINDPSALGARAALEAAGKADQVKIIGFDGQKIGKQAILEGKIVCDPIQFPERIGKTTVEMIVKHFEGEDVPAEVLIPSELYYQEDAQNDPALSEST